MNARTYSDVGPQAMPEVSLSRYSTLGATSVLSSARCGPSHLKSRPAQAAMSYAHAYAWRLDPRHEICDAHVSAFDGIVDLNSSDYPRNHKDSCCAREQPAELIRIEDLPAEVLSQILEFLDVNDVLIVSRTCRFFRALALAPILHQYRLRRNRQLLPPLLFGPLRPSKVELQTRAIILTRTSAISRKLSRALTSIRLARSLAARPAPETLVARCVIPAECVPGHARIAPALVASQRAVEKAQLKDGLRRWVGSVMERKVRERSEGVRKWEEFAGIGRVWRLRRHWERISREGSLSTAAAGRQ